MTNKKQKQDSWQHEIVHHNTSTIFISNATFLVWWFQLKPPTLKVSVSCFTRSCFYFPYQTKKKNLHRQSYTGFVVARSLIREQVLIHFSTLNNFTEKDKLRPSLPGHVPFVQINRRAGNYSKELGTLCKEVCACVRKGTCCTAKLLLPRNRVCWSIGWLW